MFVVREMRINILKDGRLDYLWSLIFTYMWLVLVYLRVNALFGVYDCRNMSMVYMIFLSIGLLGIDYRKNYRNGTMVFLYNNKINGFISIILTFLTLKIHYQLLIFIFEGIKGIRIIDIGFVIVLLFYSYIKIKEIKRHEEDLY